MILQDAAQIFLALAGTALFSAASCWAHYRLKMAAAQKKSVQQLSQITILTTEKLAAHADLEARITTATQQQQLIHDMEQQYLDMEKNWWQLKTELDNVRMENRQLLENPPEKIREIEVIREVPVLIFRSPGYEESRREKAKKLVRAFRKGYLDREMTQGQTVLETENGD